MNMKALYSAVFLVSIQLFACGPSFQESLIRDRENVLKSLPTLWFRDDMNSLVPAPDPRLFGTAKYVPYEEQDSVSPTIREEQRWIAKQYQHIPEAARNASSIQSLQKLIAHLSKEHQLYLTGAWYFQNCRKFSGSVKLTIDPKTVRLALLTFDSLAQLDPKQISKFSVRAHFMKGRCFNLLGLNDSAISSFQKARTAAVSGAPDSLQLGFTSFGEEARILFRRGNIVSAVNLYAVQGAAFVDTTRWTTSDPANSLRLCAETIVNNDSLFKAVIHDSVCQKITASYLYNILSGTYEFWGDSLEEIKYQENIQKIMDLMVENGTRFPREAKDNLAAAAFRNGRFDTARKFIAGSSTPLSWWIRAKLAVHAGNISEAAGHYAKASQGFQREAEKSGPPETPYSSYHNRPRVESAVVAEILGNFDQALEILVESGMGYWKDAAFVAERVVSTDQLIRFVENRQKRYSKPEIYKEPQYSNFVEHDKLRLLLARRLMREGRTLEAIHWFTGSEYLVEAKKYHAIETKLKQSSGVDWAEQVYYKVGILSKWGMELTGYECEPDWSSVGGSYDVSRYMESFGGYSAPFTNAEEIRRIRATEAKPNKRFHYRYLGSDLALEAAKIVTPKTEAFTFLVNKAVGIIPNGKPEERAQWLIVERFRTRSKPKFYYTKSDTPDWNAARKYAQVH